MTKRLLSFALAMIMIIGMLPMLPITTHAASPMPKVTMNDPNNTIDCRVDNDKYQNWYVVFQEVLDENGQVIGTMPVQTFTKPADNYIQYYYDSAKAVLYATFNNVNYKRTSSISKNFILIAKNASYSNAFDVVFTFNGENFVTGGRNAITFYNSKNVTFTGSGSLKIDTHVSSNAMITLSNSGDLTILDTTLEMYNSYGLGSGETGTVAGIMAKGSVIIDGSTVKINAGNKSSSIRTATKVSSDLTAPTHGITIKNGSNVVLKSNSVTTMQTNGPIIFDNSNISISKGTGNKNPVFNVAPEIIGSYSSRKGGYEELDRMYPGSFGLQPGDPVTTDHRLAKFELIHKHTPSDCTKDSLCACTKATVPATAESHSIEQMEAQTATCTESGWDAYEFCVNCAYTTKDVIPATGQHSIVEVEAQAPTCGEIGWNDYKYCQDCSYSTMVAIPATGNHTIMQAAAKAPTCGEVGWIAYEYCKNCTSYTTKVAIPPVGNHTIVHVAAKEATYSEPGWKAYDYCKNCSYSTKIEIPATGKISPKPFYLLNGDAPWEPLPYIHEKPSFFTSSFKPGQTKPTVSCYGTTNIATLAAKLKADFDNRPEGTRYFKLDAMSKTMHGLVEHNVYYDKAVDAVREWLEAFLTEYYSIGGKLDGIQVDVEYVYGGSWYVHLARYEKNPSNIYNDPDIFWSIVNDERYATDLRPMLEAWGFPFLPKSQQTSIKSEIFTLDTRYSDAYNIWNLVNSYRMTAAIEEAVYEPLIKYYPTARVTDYQVRDVYGWQKALNSTASPLLGNRIGLGTTSNFNAYSVRPNNSIYGSESYTTPPSFNDAAYKLTAFNTALWELNIMKNMYDATDSKRIAVHVGYFNYNHARKGTYANTPYYAETLFHIGLLDPEPYMGYIREVEVFNSGKNSDNPLIGDFGYNLSVVSDIMVELTRVAGASDRKPISVPAYWNSKFILSGMYAGGRNIWRITPDTSTGVSVEQFLVKDKAPTFYVDGQTVIFPQGRIISDGNIRQVGTCGYWVETPADVEPVIINDTDRYSKFPSLQENFDSYKAGTAFTSDTALPAACWDVTGSGATIQLHNGSNALALTGNTTVKSLKLPSNITAGDSYAKQQIWEVTFTAPDSGELQLLTCSDSDLGVKIADGKVYYPLGSRYLQMNGVSLSAGSTYTVKREVDFRYTNGYTASYSVYDSNGKRLGAMNNVGMATFTLPVAQIGFSCTNISGAAYIDNFKMYPTGVTTELEAYDVETGYELANPNATRTEDTAYRLSWMNASSEYKVAKVMNNGAVVEEILMAPGSDGVATGVVKGTNIKLSVTTKNGTAPTHPDYDNGDFDWDNAAEDIGLASGKTSSTKYTVVFQDWDGTVLSSKSYNRGDKVTIPTPPTKDADNVYTYTFAGWDKDVVNCEGNATYTATYNSTFIDYTVVFQDWDGTVLSSNTYHYGDAVVAPTAPTRPGTSEHEYIFAGWDKEVVNCEGNATYTATYTSTYIDYTVVFQNWDGTNLSSETYHWGDQVTAPADPTKDADNVYTYTFAGWDKVVVNCEGNATYTATYTPVYIDYTVIFVNQDGTELSKNTYHWGDAVTVPTDPAKDADNTYTYTFAGWDQEVVNCAGNATYTATYNSTFIDYTVVFQNWDGTILSSETYHWGDQVTVPADPTKDADETYTYTFAGWDKEVVNCEGNATYTATYTAVTIAIPGDINGDESVTRNDVISLLLHVTMPNRFPLNAEADFNGDGNVTRDDVIRLLLHVTMPNRFPLNG